MIGYYKSDPWSIIEEGFDPAMHEASESIFSLGNGRMGQRANFEEAIPAIPYKVAIWPECIILIRPG